MGSVNISKKIFHNDAREVMSMLPTFGTKRRRKV